MNILMSSLLVLMFIILIFSFIQTVKDFSSSSWEIHLKMTQLNNKVCKWGTYYQFLEEFYNKEWYRESKFPKSFFSLDNKSQIHASIIQFDGMGFLINKEDYKYFVKWIKRNTLKVIEVPEKKEEKELPPLSEKWGE